MLFLDFIHIIIIGTVILRGRVVNGMSTNKGNLIAELRREAGFTQKSLAEALHITDKAISKWERGLSLPDVSLLPRLSLLLGADMTLLLAKDGKHPHEGWKGLVDLRNSKVDLWQMVYDKPMVYFMLSHFLLSNIREICFLCSKENQRYLESNFFEELGFTFTFDLPEDTTRDYMILNRPCFLFGSDLTHQFQGAMLSESVVTLVPVNVAPPFLFCPAEYVTIYKKNPGYLYEIAVPRTLGRGMVCLDMDHMDTFMEVAIFVRMYQRSSGLLISSLEEIAFRKGIVPKEKFLEMAENTAYCQQLRNIADSV